MLIISYALAVVGTIKLPFFFFVVVVTGILSFLGALLSLDRDSAYVIESFEKVNKMARMRVWLCPGGFLVLT